MTAAFCGLAIAEFGIPGFNLALGKTETHFEPILIGAAVSFLAAGLFPLGAASEVHNWRNRQRFILSVLAMYHSHESNSPQTVALPRLPDPIGKWDGDATGNTGKTRRELRIQRLLWINRQAERIKRLAIAPMWTSEAAPSGKRPAARKETRGANEMARSAFPVFQSAN